MTTRDIFWLKKGWGDCCLTVKSQTTLQFDTCICICPCLHTQFIEPIYDWDHTVLLILDTFVDCSTGVSNCNRNFTLPQHHPVTLTLSRTTGKKILQLRARFTRSFCKKPVQDSANMSFESDNCRYSLASISKSKVRAKHFSFTQQNYIELLFCQIG